MQPCEQRRTASGADATCEKAAVMTARDQLAVRSRMSLSRGWMLHPAPWSALTPKPTSGSWRGAPESWRWEARKEKPGAARACRAASCAWRISGMADPSVPMHHVESWMKPKYAVGFLKAGGQNGVSPQAARGVPRVQHTLTNAPGVYHGREEARIRICRLLRARVGLALVPREACQSLRPGARGALQGPPSQVSTVAQAPRFTMGPTA